MGCAPTGGGVVNLLSFIFRANITGVPQGAKVYVEAGSPPNSLPGSSIIFNRTEELKSTPNNDYRVTFRQDNRYSPYHYYRIRIIGADGTTIYTGEVGRIQYNYLP